MRKRFNYKSFIYSMIQNLRSFIKNYLNMTNKESLVQRVHNLERDILWQTAEDLKFYYYKDSQSKLVYRNKNLYPDIDEMYLN